ncbi:MAG TPA: hypothetical protein VMW27_05495 [Thermoanaerobaculia bacterium]|nr:hypothetical protein [Thermoanaerobaculia bacterium]
MKKRDKKLQIHRDTLRRLDRELPGEDLRNAAGGVITSCIQPDCCGSEQQRIAD